MLRVHDAYFIKYEIHKKFIFFKMNKIHKKFIKHTPEKWHVWLWLLQKHYSISFNHAMRLMQKINGCKKLNTWKSVMTFAHGKL